MRVGPVRLALSTALALPILALAQAPADRPPLVVPTGVDLVQVDAVVMDKDGRQVTDLRAEDFEIVEDGKKRAIANFRYVRTGRAEAPSGPAPSAQAPVAPGFLPPSAEPGTLAIVVDDLSLTFEGNVEARRTLTRLVDERLTHGELVAIVRTGGGSGNLQQFTTDKRLLKAAIAGMPFNLGGRGPVSAVGAGGPAGMAGGGMNTGPPGDASVQAYLNRLERGVDRPRQVNLALGTLSALEAVVRALSGMPGRKALLFVSEGFVLADKHGGTEQVLARMHDVIDTANRASVVIYGLDAGGLRTYGPSASEILRTPGDVKDYASNARGIGRELQTGMESLSVDTGGLALRDTNDLDAAVGRVLDDQRGYYLLGFEPAEGASDRRRHKVSVKVKRPGLRVRSRSTFYPRSPVPARDDSTLITTLIAPFAATDVPVRLTALFHHDPPKGSFVRTLLFIDAHEITFREEPDGTLTTEVEAAALSFGAEGRFAGQAGGTYTLRMSQDAAAAALERGLVLTLDIPAEPGAFQIRSAVRDVATGRAGSAFQFIEVPDVSKGGLALSGIVMSGTDAPAPTVAAETVLQADATPAVRRFSPGDQVAYAFAVYNASRERPPGTPGLDVRISLSREGVALAVVPGPAVSVPSAAGPVPVAGALRLARELSPGTYTLLVLVRDPARRTDEQDAVQQIDFEIAVGGP